MVVLKVRLARDIGGLYTRMNRAMDEVLNLSRPLLSQPGSGWTPEADMMETEHDLLIRVNLAGVIKEDIEVAYDENYLRIEGTRSPGVSAETRARYHRLEMGFGPFERVFRIPVPIDPDRIDATFSDGILTIRMAKQDEPLTPRSVLVKN
jgi:HSP20 family protein